MTAVRLAVLAAFVLAAAPGAQAATVVLDTFGPGDAYDDGAAGLVGPGPTGDVELGFVFTAPASAPLETLTVPFSAAAGPTVVTFALRRWDGLAPEAQIDVSSARVDSATPTVLAVTGWSVAMIGGLDYVIVASAPAQTRWWEALGDPVVQSIFVLDGTTGAAPGWTPAVRLEVEGFGGVAPVPLPGAAGLLFGALGALGLAARRRRRG